MARKLLSLFVFGVMCLALNTSVVVGSQVATGSAGMVASAHILASEAGARILAAGGNAVDAAVAAAFVITVVEPNASSLGGEGYMVISLADGRDLAIDFRAWSPGHVTIHTRRETRGPNAVGIPGMVAGVALALEEFGTMTLADVLAPALELARDGFAVDAVLYDQLAAIYADFVFDPVVGPLYFPEGIIPDVGTILVNHDLAQAFELIAAQGARAFYRGEIGAAIVEATGGWIRSADLQRYQAVLRDAVVSDYRGYQIVGAPPIVAGIPNAFTFNVLELYDMASFSGWADPSAIHIMSQAMLLADSDRLRYVGDPDYYSVPAAELLSPEYAAVRATLIDMDKAISPPGSTPFGDPFAGEAVGYEELVESYSTTHISVVDSEGNAVSLTQTISSFWGARVMVPGYGFFLNNQMQNFNLYRADRPDDVNVIGAYKRPRTVIAPTIVRYANGDVYMVIGTPGAGRIPSTIVCTIVNVIDFGMSLEDAIRAPKFSSRTGYRELHLEGGHPQETIDALVALGHVLNLSYGELDLFFGGVNAIIVDTDGVMTGVGAFRRDGGAAGP